MTYAERKIMRKITRTTSYTEGALVFRGSLEVLSGFSVLLWGMSAATCSWVAEKVDSSRNMIYIARFIDCLDAWSENGTGSGISRRGARNYYICRHPPNAELVAVHLPD